MNITAKELRVIELRKECDGIERGLVADRMRAAKTRAAYDRQSRLTVATISNAAWMDTHTERFIRLARRAMPDAEFALVYVGKDKDIAKSKTPAMFDRMITTPDDNTAQGYLHYNAIRYRLCSGLGVDEVVYIDPDVDIVSDISAITEDCTASLGWCRSPVEPAGFADACRKMGLSGDAPWANSGTLVMRGDFDEAYAKAADDVAAVGFDPRMIGNLSFSAMLRVGGVDHQEIPYKYGSIWWDYANLPKALCVHYCNDNGKARRMMLDRVWVG